MSIRAATSRGGYEQKHANQLTEKARMPYHRSSSLLSFVGYRLQSLTLPWKEDFFILRLLMSQTLSGQEGQKKPRLKKRILQESVRIL